MRPRIFLHIYKPYVFAFLYRPPHCVLYSFLKFSYLFVNTWSISFVLSNLCVHSCSLNPLIILLMSALLICVFIFLSVLLEICQFYSVFQRISSLFHWFSLLYFYFQFIDFCSYTYFLPPASFWFILLFFFLVQGRGSDY